MINIKIIDEGEDLNTFTARMTRDAWAEFQEAFYNLGTEIHQLMQANIANNIKSNSGNLINSIEFGWETHGYGALFWIGDIEHMDKVAPYWKLLNYGGSVEKYGGRTHFVPGHFEGGHYVYEQGAKTGMQLPSGLIPTAVIKPINYIENTIHELESRLNTIVDILNGGKVWGL